MNNNTEVVFENIEARILKEIKDAHYSIFVSVAWFTNKKLFDALLEKAKTNCYVSIIIQLDEINSQCGIDYGQIQIGRSECLQISKDSELLHDKFCVIDFQKVITGSYNWTYKASHNSENILILTDPSVAAQYISRFEQQKVKLKKECAQQTTHISSISSNNDRITKSPYGISPKTNKVCLNFSCGQIIGYNDRFCPYCGKTQHNNNTPSISVTCRTCASKQNEVLVDAFHTRYCTNCGSDELEWKLV